MPKNPWGAKNNRVAAAVEAWEPKVAAMDATQRAGVEHDLGLLQQSLPAYRNAILAAVQSKLLTVDEGTLALGIIQSWADATLADRLGVDTIVRDLLLQHADQMARALRRG